MELPSVYIYGMRIHALDDTVYGSLYGNATRSVGLAFNLSKIGHEVFLEVENDFVDQRTSCSEEPVVRFVFKHERMSFLPQAGVLLVSCTNIQSFKEFFHQDPYLEHECKVIASCFDLGQSIDLYRLEPLVRFITFNNELQKGIWDARRSLIPSSVIPYGVNELAAVDESIVEVSSDSAIWIGAIRRIDILQRIVRFAAVNSECSVTVATRTIFDYSVKDGERGSLSNPFGDFTGRDPLTYFAVLVQELCGYEMPKNLNFIGPSEGLNHILQGEHTIGLDFSRFPAQKHDNTKILDYLRSGLAVICDRGTPSFRFVEEMNHGVVVSPEFTDEEIRAAYMKCRESTSCSRRREVAKEVVEKYGWDAAAVQYSKIICKASEAPKPSALKLALSRPKTSFYRVRGIIIRKCKGLLRYIFISKRKNNE